MLPKLWYLLRYLGWRWALYRLWYSVQQRSGWLERQCPVSPWDDLPLASFLQESSLAAAETYLHYRREGGPAFFFSPRQRSQFAPLFVLWDDGKECLPGRAELLLQGQWPYFAHTLAQVGFPPHWHQNPFTGQVAPGDRHWNRISDFGYGDIKIIWEPSRFSPVYDLVRTYWRTRNEQYAELFWRLIESWRLHNPPHCGPNWKCGQEISFRVMAWCFGLYGFLESPASTATRVMALAQMIAVSGRRIATNLPYALSQRNNHGISAGMGLWTIGVLFPELREAVAWRALGRDVLEKQGRMLIYADGTFAQHSVNYHRLMLHDYLWALRLGDLHAQPFSVALRERLYKACMFLYNIQDVSSGGVPCYGQNDGALILPLNHCDALDFRPVVQATCYLCTGRRCYPSGPWDEDLLWLFGPAACNAPVVSPERQDYQAATGGYYTLRALESFVFTRCATFRHRPSQADMLHVDVWWRGQNIAVDAGTYSYNAPAPWDNPLCHTAYHNTVMVDDRDQMQRVGKFLWLPWLQAWKRTYHTSPEGLLTYWEGEHNGYRHLKPCVSYRRGIMRLGPEHWLVLDALQSPGVHRYRLHWLLADFPYTWEAAIGHLTLQTPRGAYHLQTAALLSQGKSTLVRACAQSPRGWQAPYYTYRTPALSVETTVEARTTYFWTLFGPTPWRVVEETGQLTLTGVLGHIQLCLHKNPQEPLVTSAHLAGSVYDNLLVS